MHPDLISKIILYKKPDAIQADLISSGERNYTRLVGHNGPLVLSSWMMIMIMIMIMMILMLLMMTMMLNLMKMRRFILPDMLGSTMLSIR